MSNAYRRLEFATLDAAAAEIRALHERGYDRLGQWTLGQMCHHLAFVMRGSLDGFPAGVKAPPLLRLLVSNTKRFWLDRPIPKGIKLRGPLAVLTPPEPDRCEEQAAIAEALACLERLQREDQRYPSPVAGRLTRAQWDTLHRRHTAHHLGFLVPRA